MKYSEPETVEFSTERRGNVIRSEVFFDRMDAGPVAPAGLYFDPRSGTCDFALHRVTYRDGLRFAFETFGHNESLPMDHCKLRYRGWWLQEAMDAILDANAVWHRKSLCEVDSDESCLFSWEPVRRASSGFAWVSVYGWCTEAAHSDHVIDDIWGLRERPELSSEFERYP